MPSKAFLAEQKKLRAAQERDRIAKEQGRKPGPSPKEARSRAAAGRRQSVIGAVAPKEVKSGLDALVGALTQEEPKKKKKK